MPVFLKDGRAVLFPHVPKTGGTSVEKLFGRSGWEVRLRDTEIGRGTLHYVRRCSPQHLHASILEQLLDATRMELVFMLVRDPISRFRSEFAMRHKEEGPGDGATVDRWADRVFGKYVRNPYIFDNHLRPQSQFYLPGAHVFRLEDGIDTAMRQLSERYDLGLLPEVPHSMRREKVSGFSSSEVMVSPALEDRIRHMYAEDYQRFGY